MEDKELPEKLKLLADMLVGTLGDVSSKDADETVEKVALVLYNDILGIEGEIKKSGMYLCMIDGIGGGFISNVKFIPKETT